MKWFGLKERDWLKFTQLAFMPKLGFKSVFLLLYVTFFPLHVIWNMCVRVNDSEAVTQHGFILLL